jgi:hypothetical protein
LILSHERSISAAILALGPAVEAGAAMKLPPVSKRLYAALLASCLLHAALFALPYSGRNTSIFQPALSAAQNSAAAPAVRITLAPANSGRFAIAGLAPKNASLATPPAKQASSEEQPPAPTRIEGTGLLPITAGTYYTTDLLSKHPAPIGPVELDAPELASIIAAGTVTLKLWIDELGNVVSIDVEKTDLPEAFSKAAVAAFKSVNFTPGELDGRHVASLMRIEVSYEDSRVPPP